MTGPQKYTKKQVEIEAMEWDGTPGGATPIIAWVRNSGGYAQFDPRQHFQASHHIMISTLEGPITASPGDFIIRGTQGEFYPCKPDIFRAIHEMPGDTDTLHGMPALGDGPVFKINVVNGNWISDEALTYEQGIRIAASVLPGISMDQLALWVDEQKFDSGPKQ